MFAKQCIHVDTYDKNKLVYPPKKFQCSIVHEMRFQSIDCHDHQQLHWMHKACDAHVMCGA